jgi:hypothetical protein
MTANITIDANTVIRKVAPFMLGVNLSGWDTYLSANTDTGLGVAPDDRTAGMIRDAGLGLIRLSNGSGADEFHFSAANGQFPVGVGLLGNMVAATQAQALITVNYGTGTPEEAAAYLAYLNATTDSAVAIGVDRNGKDWGQAADWARLRGQTQLGGDPLDMLRAGHPDPFGAKFFEIGNEVYFGNWAGAPASVAPADYVKFASDFAAKARLIDPSAAIGLGLGNPIEYDDLWNRPVLQQCRDQGFTPAFISDHFYIYDGNIETLGDQDLLLHSLTDPASAMPSHAGSPRNWAGRANLYRTLLTDVLGDAGASVQLVCCEFNTDADAANKQATNLVRGLMVAEAVGSILQTEYAALILWDMRNSYADGANDPTFYGWRTGADEGLVGVSGGAAPATGPYVPYPAYFGARLGASLLQGAGSVVAVSSDTPAVSAYAATLTTGQMVLLLMNKSASADTDVAITLSGFTPATAATFWRYGMQEDAAQQASADGSASLTRTDLALPVEPTPTGGQITQNFPAYSMTVLSLSPAA